MGAERCPKTTYIQVLKGRTDCTFCIKGKVFKLHSSLIRICS